MIIVILRGGLGNQLFQLAAALHLSNRKLLAVRVDDRFYSQDKNGRRPQLDHLGICPRRVGALEHALVRAIAYLVRRFPGSRGVRRNLLWSYLCEGVDHGFPYKRDRAAFSILDGYWQHYQYADACADLLREKLRSWVRLTSFAARLAADARGTRSLSLHVRRGDYVTDPVAQKVHGTCDVGYYHRAIELVESRTVVERIYVFSDDTEWAQRNLGLDSRAVYVSAGHEFTDIEEFCLMAACRNFVIANSTFSWWAARIGDAPDKVVVAPRRWYRHPLPNQVGLIPPEWFQLE